MLHAAGYWAIATGLLGLLCLGSVWQWEQDIQERCNQLNCVIDRRSWSEAHPVPSVALAVFAALCVGSLLVHLMTGGGRPTSTTGAS
jgi:hypothetical protein